MSKTKTNTLNEMEKLEKKVVDMFQQKSDLTGVYKWNATEICIICGIKKVILRKIIKNNPSVKRIKHYSGDKNLPNKSEHKIRLNEIEHIISEYIKYEIKQIIVNGNTHEKSIHIFAKDHDMFTSDEVYRYAMFRNKLKPSVKIDITKNPHADYELLITKRDKLKKKLSNCIQNDLLLRKELINNPLYTVTDVGSMYSVQLNQIRDCVSDYKIDRTSYYEVYKEDTDIKPKEKETLLSICPEYNKASNVEVEDKTEVKKLRDEKKEILDLYKLTKPKNGTRLYSNEDIATILNIQVSIVYKVIRDHQDEQVKTRSSSHEKLFGVLFADLMAKKELLKDSYLYTIEEIIFIHNETPESIKTFMKKYGVTR